MSDIDIIGIKGKLGAGKSTVAKLLQPYFVSSLVVEEVSLYILKKLFAVSLKQRTLLLPGSTEEVEDYIKENGILIEVRKEVSGFSADIEIKDSIIILYNPPLNKLDLEMRVAKLAKLIKKQLSIRKTNKGIVQ